LAQRVFKSRHGGGVVNTRKKIKNEVDLFDLMGFPLKLQHLGLKHTNAYLTAKYPDEPEMCIREFRALFGVLLFMGQSRRVRRSDFWSGGDYGSGFVRSAFPKEQRFARVTLSIRWANLASFSAKTRDLDSIWRLRLLIGNCYPCA
jgi:hypothetical protein